MHKPMLKVDNPQAKAHSSSKGDYNRFQALGGAILTRLVNRPITLLVLLAIAVPIAVVVSGRLASQVWQSNATILFLGNPQGEPGKEVVPSPDFKSVMSLLKTQSIYEEALAKQNLHVPTKALETSLVATTPPGTRTIQLALNWGDPEDANALLETLIQEYSRVVADLRRQKAKDRRIDLEGGLVDLQKRMTDARKALVDFQTTHLVSDLTVDMTKTMDEIQNIESSLRKAESFRKSTEAQMKVIDLKLNQMKQEDTQLETETQKSQAAEDSIADNRRRQDRMREMISEQRRTIELEAAINVRKLDLNRLLRLAAQNAVAPSTVEAAKAEIVSLEAQLKGNQRTQTLEKEMEAIDKVVVPKANKKNQGSPIIHQTLDKRLERELLIEGMDQEIAIFKEQMVAARKRLQTLKDLWGQNNVLTGTISTLELQRNKLEDTISACRQVEGIKSGDFSIVTPPTTGEHPLKSNRKMLMIQLGGGVFLAGLVLVLAWDLKSGFKSNEVSAWALGLPVVSRLQKGELELDHHREERLSEIAQMVRTQARDHGAVVFLTPNDEEAEKSEGFLLALGNEFAERDERVLLVDFKNPGSGSGLHEYMTYQASAEDLANPVGPGVDIVHCGASPLNGNRLSTRHLENLIQSWKEQYSLILFWGPALDQTGKVTRIASWSQLHLVVTSSHEIPKSKTFKTLRELDSHGARPSGQIIIS